MTVSARPGAAPSPFSERSASGGQTNGGPSIPHVVAFNLTRRCNLACSHCYISAGAWHSASRELDTASVLRIVDQVLAVNPAPMLVLTGGEPLVRDDTEDIARHASSCGATVVVGTNGTRLTDHRIASLMASGVTGVAVSVDSLNETYHDRFRHGADALSDTLAAVERLGAHGLDFVVQTSLTRGNRDELGPMAAWAAEMGAVSFNVYFVVPTGRGELMRGLAPEENDAVLADLVKLERQYRGQMLVRSKCQPQIMRHVWETDPDSPLLNYPTRCPCGVQYVRITPEGKVTPCPYTPVVAGDLTESSFSEIWERSEVLTSLRTGTLGGRCGRCEYRGICGGCRARAHATTGDLMGPDEACAYEPAGHRPVLEPQGVTTYGQPAPLELTWSPEALARVKRIPSFVRGVVTTRVEKFAKEQGYGVVDLAVMAEVRRKMPVDFSRKLPFFLRGRPDVAMPSEKEGGSEERVDI